MAGQEADGPTVQVCAVGDIGLSGRALSTLRSAGGGSLFAEVRDFLRSADLCFGNLETPLAGQVAPDRIFAAPVEGAGILREAGFKIVHLANNHVGDHGQAGLAATLQAVRAAGLLPLGAGDSLAEARSLLRTDQKGQSGIRIGWLGCGRTLLQQPGTGVQYWEFDPRELREQVAQARPLVDVLIVSIHIGLMYLQYPRPEHKAMAEELLAGGADLVLMHHAHVLQGVQVAGQGRICCYNLGNFLFDWQEGNVRCNTALREQNESGVFVFDLDRRGVVRAIVLPTWIDDACCVRWATGARGTQILQRLQRISAALHGDYAKIFAEQRAERNAGNTLQVLAFHARHGNFRYVLEQLLRARPEHLGMVIRWAWGRLRRA